MLRWLQRFFRKDKGQALPIVLALLAIGGLTIATNLNYATTALNGGRVVEDHTKGVYAAGSGIEYVLWYLQMYGTPPASPMQLSENISEMTVTVRTEETGTFTMYLGGMVVSQPGPHNDWFNVSSVINWEEGVGAWKYTISIDWVSGTKTIKLDELGARLPPGYGYRDDLPVTASDDILGTMQAGYPMLDDSGGAYLVNWEFGPSDPKTPKVSENQTPRTQSFYISYESGSGSLEGYYAWVVAQSEDVGTVSDITGARYTVTGTAARLDGRGTAYVVADVIKEDGTGNIYILSWQVLK
ncbi:MAG: hypothetical protein ABIH70_07650 [Chloroflexota bacterium]